MTYQPISIAGFQSGLMQSLDDSLIPDDAFPSLRNAYVWRKKLLKKGGHTSFGRLGNRSDDVAAAGGTLSYFPIEPGSMSYDDGANTFVDTPDSATTGTIAGGTINYATGVYAGLPFPGTMTYIVEVDEFSPAMGIFERELREINDEQCIAFDRKMAYAHDGTDFVHLKFFIGGTNEVSWNGTNSEFFTATNYYGSFWATNSVPGLHGYAITGITQAANGVVTIGAHAFQNGDIVHFSGISGMIELNGQSATVTAIAAATITISINTAAYGAYTAGGFAQALTHQTAASGDGIRWYAGSGWANHAPPLSSSPATPYLMGCKFIIPFKDRLICMNTWEGTNYANRRNYYNRIRWSGALSTPYYTNVFPTGYSGSASVWYQEPGNGGYLDAPTEEELLGVEYLKDYLIIFFEKSTYILTYTGNRNLPFQFQKIDTNYGCESYRSYVPFDNEVLAITNRGICQATTSGAYRIDEKIPDLVFEMQNNLDGVQRIHGIRNFFPDVVFWIYRSIDTTIQGTFPNKLLVYNYANESWAIFDTSLTCFGNHITTRDLTWDEILDIWDDYDVIWDDARTQSNNPTTIAGNQQGYVFALDYIGENAVNGNAISLSIKSISAANPSVFTCINHNLDAGDFVQLSGIFGIAPATSLNNGIYKVSTTSLADDTFTLTDVNGDAVSVAAGYLAGGKVKTLDNFEIVTKSFNPVIGYGAKARFGMIDILANCDDEAVVEVQTYIDKAPYPTTDFTTSDTLTLESCSQRQKWYRIFSQAIGQFIQLRLTHPESFMFSKEGTHPLCRTGVDITIIQLWFSKSGRNIQ